ncbi:hypothetical protein [Streptomyces sp. MBT62]|uniref:hypothetical protein n=1 Tax=Streptomyces sp. MBT62 TaxID=2800410 RepID=UPI001F235B52|nr:hypothetical protein [Streptomyces sp. MBT62]
MMERIPFALTGYLDTEAVPGDAVGTASWRLISSPADCEAQEEAVIPCTTSRPDLAHLLLTECQPSDLLRVTGHLALPDTADGRIRLDVDTVDVMWEAPAQEQPFEGSVDDHRDRDRAIQALAEALAGLAYEPATGEQPDIRINIGPVGINELDVAHCHSLDVTTANTHKLADAVDAMLATLNSLPPQTGISLDPLTIAELTDYFDELDLTELTRDVLDVTRPEDRLAVTRALDDVFGDIPVTGIDDSDQ